MLPVPDDRSLPLSLSAASLAISSSLFMALIWLFPAIAILPFLGSGVSLAVVAWSLGALDS